MSDNGLLANQCYHIVNWAPRNKSQWYLNQNTITFIHENAVEYVVCKKAATFVGSNVLIVNASMMSGYLLYLVCIHIIKLILKCHITRFRVIYNTWSYLPTLLGQPRGLSQSSLFKLE